MIKAWRNRHLKQITHKYLCFPRERPDWEREHYELVYIVPASEHEEVQAVLAAAERVDKSFDGKVNPTALEKVEQANALISLRVALTKIRKVTK